MPGKSGTASVTNNLEMPLCQVCNQRRAVGVHSSPWAAMSIAYCPECLWEDAEPLWLVESLLEINGGPQGCNEAFLNTQTWKDGQYIEVRTLPWDKPSTL
jgi:hypothetical protein